VSKHPKKSKRSLRRRAERFLNTDLYGRREVREFCEKVGDVGDVAIFGGMLRDLLLEGNQKFSSDIDLVIDCTDISRLQQVLAPYSPSRTAFGGYRIRLPKWHVDIWPLEWTWAFRNGHVKGETLADLTSTTFFNWDAIVYEVRSGAIHFGSSYLDDLSDRLLTINLAANPNPEGVALRALRMAVTKQARLSFVLAQYAADVLETLGIEALLQVERRRQSRSKVERAVMIDFLDQFRRAKAEERSEPITLTSRQIQLGFASSAQQVANETSDGH
jgi:predicted nucleotidyltransferase